MPSRLWFIFSFSKLLKSKSISSSLTSGMVLLSSNRHNKVSESEDLKQLEFEESFLDSSSFWWLLAISVLFCVAGEFQSLPPSSRGLAVCVSAPLCQRHRSVTGLRAYTDLWWPHSLVYTCKRLSSKVKTHSRVSGIRTSACIFENTIWPTIETWVLVYFFKKAHC